MEWIVIASFIAIGMTFTYVIFEINLHLKNN